ncbi:MAG: DciA family protein [Pseudomonadota bacterium]
MTGMQANKGKSDKIARRKRGFEQAGALASTRIRKASESRGFAVSRLLTHWAEVVGPDIARIARPVDVNYGRGFGATLTLLTTGAEAPMLEMQKETIRERVNVCYGYAAIQKIRITQTAATGFADGHAVFEPEPKMAVSEKPVKPEAARMAETVGDSDLRQALEKLGTNVLSHSKR